MMLAIQVSYLEEDGTRTSLDPIENPDRAWPDISACLRRPAVTAVVLHFDDGTQFEYRRA